MAAIRNFVVNNILLHSRYFLFRIIVTGIVIGSLALIAFSATLKAASIQLGPALEPVIFMPVIYGIQTSKSGCLPSPPIPPDDQNNEITTIAGINDARSANGQYALTTVYELTQSSRRHSHDMADTGFTGHTGSDGTNAGERVKEACYQWISVAEIIGWGFGGSTQSMINWWLDSPPHKATILSPYFEDAGAGYADNSNSRYRTYWTVNFGRRGTKVESTRSKIPVCTFSKSGPDGGSMLQVYDEEFCQILFKVR